MGCDTIISYSKVFLGFGISSDEVINAEYENINKMNHDKLARHLDEKFKSFLKKKFNDSIPKEFSAMQFVLGYDEYLAAREVCPYSFRNLVHGYNLETCVGKPKNLNKLSEIKFSESFPENCLDTLVEFYAGYKLRQDRKKKIVKHTKNDDEEYDDDGFEEYDSEDDDSEDEAFPEFEFKKLKTSISKNISFGLHGFVC